MVASVGLVASLPLGYIDYLGRLPLNKKTKTTGWVEVPKKWNLCKKAVVAAARSLKIETVRTRSIVSFAGMKTEDCDGIWIDPMLMDVTYSFLPDATRQYKNNKYFHSVTSDEGIVDDLSHEPSVMTHSRTLAYVSTYHQVECGDGARSTSCDIPEEAASTLCDIPEEVAETAPDLWRNVWVSKNKDGQCSSSSLSNLLHFLGDSSAGNEIHDIKDICHDQQQMMKKYDNIHFSKELGETALDWMTKMLRVKHGYITPKLDQSLMKTTSEIKMIVEKIQLPMIVSVLILGDNGIVPINHVLGFYKGMIIDGESDTAQVFSEQNLNKACGYNVCFYGIMNAYLLLPPKKTVKLKGLPPAHRNFSSLMYKVMNENGNSMDLFTPIDKLKKKRNRKKRSWDGLGKKKKLRKN